MRNQKLSGTVLALVFLFCRLSFANGGRLSSKKRQMPFMHHMNWNQPYCDRCIYGTCSYRHHNGGVTYNHCECNPGWTGDACDIQTGVPITIINEPACNDHGQMTSSGCQCHDAWSGDICQYPPGAGHYDHCFNHCVHGTCVGHNSMSGNYFNCKCDQGWHGTHCTQAYAPQGTVQCHNTYCNHGECWYLVDQFGYEYNHHCKCYQGWDGDHCDQQLAVLPVQSTVQCHNTYCNHGECWYLVDQFGYEYNYHCICNQGWDGDHCDQQLAAVSSTTHVFTSPSTSAMPPSITTHVVSSPSTSALPQSTTTHSTLPPASATSSHAPTSIYLSTTVPSPSSSSVALPSCNHINTLSDIARQSQVVDHDALECSPGSHTSHEAFVLSECSVPQKPSSWQHGVNVMTDCGSLITIPTYTPIASFDNGLYSSVGSLSGIFLGCTSNGFKVAIQTCGQAPYITDMQLGGSKNQNPNMYYTLS